MSQENGAIIEPHDSRGDLYLDCDAVIVGSGAGGATMAATLAEAGLDVIVLEEGPLLRTEDYSADVGDMFSKMMRGGGSTVMLGRSPVPYLEGRCVGGTTVVNGGMCWRTPDKVLSSWVRRGLFGLSSKALEPHFDEVENTIDARYQDPGSHGGGNDVFYRGATSLGWKLSRNKRNQRHCVGSNDCVTGCPSGAKRSTLYSWLPRAFAAGARLHTHMKVEKILTRGGRAVGVAGHLLDPFQKRRFKVTARAVVLSCGAIQTPLLLQRNKLCRPCGHVGEHFTIHPNVKLAARFDEPVDSLRGTHQAYQCVEFIDEGILFAPGGIPLAFMTALFREFGPQLAARLRRDYRYLATGGVLVDDHAEGRIRTLPFGLPYIRYDVTDVDQAKFIRAAALLAEMYFAAGANEVYTAFHHHPVLKSPDDIKKLYAAPPRVQDTEYFTAHLMGTCRMSADKRDGVVDPRGQTWDVPDLYLADASVMPGTIGVNPQVTIMALSRLIATSLADKLAARRGGGARVVPFIRPRAA
ncbi:MAG: GMC family oxidoreductase [Myxococcales bacterium]|nr:GMC family oxidoreductase [Myxococcales bacterium]